jgi:hypothetical protein
MTGQYLSRENHQRGIRDNCERFRKGLNFAREKKSPPTGLDENVSSLPAALTVGGL